jgi:rRNA methylases
MRKLRITELNRLSEGEFKEAKKIPLTIILDNVRSLHNVGSVFRTSDAFLVEAICLCGITAVPPHPEIHKTALGAEFSVNWKYFDNTLDVVDELKQSGYQIIAIEQAEDSIMLNDFQTNPNQHYAIVLGNEVKGVDQAVLDRCDACIEIPQFGTKHSLNVSVATGIVVWEFFEQLSVI